MYIVMDRLRENGSPGADMEKTTTHEHTPSTKEQDPHTERDKNIVSSREVCLCGCLYAGFPHFQHNI